jgi:uncharacterized protein (DUF736 family)
MANNNVAAPNLPVGPTEYDSRYQNQFLSILRLFFTQITNKVNSPVPHGSFYDTTTQTNPVANAVNLMQVNSVYDSADGTQYAIKKDTTKIYVTQTGVYNIQFSAQLDKTGGSASAVYIWIRVNGQNVAHSATKVVIDGPNSEIVAAWNWVLTLAANDYIELAWESPDTNVVLAAVAATGNIPEIPSVIVTVTWVSAVNI